MIEVEESRPLLLPVLVFFFNHLQQAFLVGLGFNRTHVPREPNLTQEHVQGARAHHKAHVERGARAESFHHELWIRDSHLRVTI